VSLKKSAKKCLRPLNKITMKNISTLVFLFLAISIAKAQNIDKLTLKGGVMVGIPDIEELHIDNSNYRGQCVGYECNLFYKGSLKFENAVNVFAGIDYSPFNIKLLTQLYLLPYLGLNTSLISSNYQYSLNNQRGSYHIASLLIDAPLGIKLNVEKFNIEILSSMSMGFYRPFVDFVISENNTDNSIIHSRNNLNYGEEQIRANITYSFELRYKLKKNIGLLAAYNAPFFRNYNGMYSGPRQHVGNVYPRVYHQISLGLTYQLLSHKNKTPKD
jgi:hypothetical protein